MLADACESLAAGGGDKTDGSSAGNAGAAGGGGGGGGGGGTDAGADVRGIIAGISTGGGAVAEK